MKKEDLVNINNIYIGDYFIFKYDSLDEKLDNMTILLEDTTKKRSIGNINYNEYIDLISGEMILVDKDNNIFNTKDGEFEYLEKMISVSDLLDSISSKHNSKYTDYINSKVNESLGNECMVSRDALYNNLQNLEYLRSYNLNMQDYKVRVKNK